MMNKFKDKFAPYSNAELLRIIHNPENYEAAAVETASYILSNRQLTVADLEYADRILIEEIQRQKVLDAKKSEIKNRIKSQGLSLIDSLNPIQKTRLAENKVINLISLVFTGYFLFRLYKESDMISFVILGTAEKWDLSIITYFLSLLIVPVMTGLFYLRKRSGWILLAIYLGFSVVISIGLFILTFNNQPGDFDTVFPQPSPSQGIASIIFFGGMLWVISNEKIREIYAIDRRSMSITIGLTTLVTAGAMGVLFF